MNDPVTAAARAAAELLAAEYGPGLRVEVEAALDARGAPQRPVQYLDPVSLGSLIVSAATLAWTIYADLRKSTLEPATDEVARQVSTELRERGDASPQKADRITEVVVTEIIKVTRNPR